MLSATYTGTDALSDGVCSLADAASEYFLLYSLPLYHLTLTLAVMLSGVYPATSVYSLFSC